VPGEKGVIVSQFEEMMTETKDLVTVKRVYGEPYQSNGVTLIPAASVRGGMGSGEGEGSGTTPAGRGGGMGISARPIGAYRIKGDDVDWVPAVDVSRVIVTGQLVAMVALLVIRSILKARSKRA
jgi:uncharacterized spore protein YtfJ